MHLLKCLLVCLLIAPAVAAGSADAPELTDAAGDVYLQTADAPPVPYADGSDLRAVWLDDDPSGLHVTFQVQDLAALSWTDVGRADTMFFLLYQPAFAEPSGAALRNGDWMIRADYQPANPEPWRFWIERPCLDGNEDDGCAGGDRDIIDGLTGTLDESANTITIHTPWSVLANPQPGDGITQLRASSQMVWPAWPAYAVDWDRDEADQCYAFQTHPDERVDAPLGTRPSGDGTAGATIVGADESTAKCGTVPAAPTETEARQVVAQPAPAAENGTQEAAAPPVEDAPGLAWPLAGLVLLALARRQNP